MNKKKFFSLGIKNKVFKIPQNEVSFIYSKNFDDIFFPFKNFVQNKKTKRNDLLQIQNGKIPALSLSEEIKIESPKNVIPIFFNPQLIGKEIYKGILINENPLNEQDFFSSQKNKICDDCKSTIFPILNEDFLLNFCNQNKNSTIYLGINSWQDCSSFDIKKLIKKNIYYILKEDLTSLKKEIIEIDEVKSPFNFRFMTTYARISTDNIQDILEIIKNFSNKKIESLFLYLKEKDEFIPINLNSSFYCEKCNKIIASSLVAQNNDLEILNIKIKNILKDDSFFFNSLNNCISKDNLKNILNSLSNFGFKDFSLNDKIEFAHDAFLLNLISSIECNKNNSKIFFLAFPLSFLNPKDLQKILDLLKNETVIIFENNEDILLKEKVFKLEDENNKKLNLQIDEEFYKEKINFNLPIKNHSINIINSKECDIANQLKPLKFNKIISLSFTCTSDTFLASYIGVFNYIRDIITKTIGAKKLGLEIKDFNLSGKHAKTCKACLGKGYIKNSFNILKECTTCHGGIYNKQILNLKFKDKTLLEILKMTVLEANDFFAGFLKISNKLKVLSDLGFSNYPLNYPTAKLSINKLKVIEIFNNLNELSKDNMYILKDGLIFLSQEEKGRLFKTIEPNLKTNTIIFEAKY